MRRLLKRNSLLEFGRIPHIFADWFTGRLRDSGSFKRLSRRRAPAAKGRRPKYRGTNNAVPEFGLGT